MLKKLLYVKGAGRATILVSVLFAVLVLLVNLYYIDRFSNPTIYQVLLRSFLILVVPALLFPGVIWLSLKFPLFGSWRRVILHIFFSFSFVSVFVLVFQTILLSLQGYYIFSESLEFILSTFRRQLLLHGSMSFLLYWGVAVLSGMQKYYKDISELTEKNNMLEEKLSKATLSTLKAQLKPHFLFNTLNMVDFLIHTEPKKAIETISKLEELIKSTFDQNQPNTCTIEAEIIFLKKYLDIEKSRFNDRLSLEFDIEKQTEEIRIPCYIIQPLVENSIKHAVSKSLNASKITISSKISDDLLKIVVSDDGQERKKKPLREEWSTGLKNIDERLKIFFGEGAMLEVDILESGGFRSSILVPQKYFKSS